MKSPTIVILGTLALATMLSACGGSTAVNGALTSVVTEVDQIAVQTCKFLPTEQAIEAIFGAGDPLLATPQTIANAICTAINGTSTTKSKFRRLSINGQPVIEVNGKAFVVQGVRTQ